MTSARCIFCGREVNADRDYRKVTGWERHRHQGGTNHLALRQPSHEWACESCISKQQRGLNATQGSLAL